MLREIENNVASERGLPNSRYSALHHQGHASKSFQQCFVLERAWSGFCPIFPYYTASMAGYYTAPTEQPETKDQCFRFPSTAAQLASSKKMVDHIHKNHKTNEGSRFCQGKEILRKLEKHVRNLDVCYDRNLWGNRTQESKVGRKVGNFPHN